MLHLFFQVEIEVGSWARTLHTSPGASLSSLPWNFKPGIACQYLFPYSGRQKSGFEIFVFLVPVAVDELAVGSRAGAPVLEVVAENNLLLLFLKKNKLKSDPNIAMILLFTICQWMGFFMSRSCETSYEDCSICIKLLPCGLDLPSDGLKKKGVVFFSNSRKTDWYYLLCPC